MHHHRAFQQPNTGNTGIKHIKASISAYKQVFQKATRQLKIKKHFNRQLSVKHRALRGFIIGAIQASFNLRRQREKRKRNVSIREALRTPSLGKRNKHTKGQTHRGAKYTVKEKKKEGIYKRVFSSISSQNPKMAKR